MVFLLTALFGVLTALGKWALEMSIMYGRKVAFFLVIMGLFTGILYGVSTAVFTTASNIGGSASFAALNEWNYIFASIFPSNFLPLLVLIVALEFQVFLFRWALKVLDIKVGFFGS